MSFIVDCNFSLVPWFIFFDDAIRAEGNPNNILEGIVDTLGNANISWTITQEDYDNSYDKEEFIFIVNNRRSDRLTIIYPDLG